MEPRQYFADHSIVHKRMYDALRAFFFENKSAAEVAQLYGYKLSAFYSLSRDFRQYLNEHSCMDDFFFKSVSVGRKKTQLKGLDDMIIGLRKNNYSAPDIVGIVNAQGYEVSYGYIYSLLRREGFSKLPRRSDQEKAKQQFKKIKAPVSEALDIYPQKFHSNATGILIFLSLIKTFAIDKLIEQSNYPQTKQINRLSSILSFVALKLSNVKRYSSDDNWCMDRGLGMFAGLNVLPKSAWLSSYSDRVTTQMNLQFLRSLHDLWVKHDLLSDTTNLDFTTIPYWGDDMHLENNWSGKRNKALSSILTVLAQDHDNGIIDYGKSDVHHSDQSRVILEYLDFYRAGESSEDTKLKYLVFDSKFTNYENLSHLDDMDIKFLTIRRRGKNMVEQLKYKKHKTIRVSCSGLKKRTLKVCDEQIKLKGYGGRKASEIKTIRQVAISGSARIKPALILTNDFDLETEYVVRKYARRWLVEKGISEQIEFFHLNCLSSSMVIKVDFDLTMTILAHNLYRLLANALGRYEHMGADKIYRKFISNNGMIHILSDRIKVELKKKRDLPQILELIDQIEVFNYQWLGDMPIEFYPSATS